MTDIPEEALPRSQRVVQIIATWQRRAWKAESEAALLRVALHDIRNAGLIAFNLGDTRSQREVKRRAQELTNDW